VSNCVLTSLMGLYAPLGRGRVLQTFLPLLCVLIAVSFLSTLPLPSNTHRTALSLPRCSEFNLPHLNLSEEPPPAKYRSHFSVGLFTWSCHFSVSFPTSKPSSITTDPTLGSSLGRAHFSLSFPILFPLANLRQSQQI
jgi:hypothetical protein